MEPPKTSVERIFFSIGKKKKNFQQLNLCVCVYAKWLFDPSGAVL